MPIKTNRPGDCVIYAVLTLFFLLAGPVPAYAQAPEPGDGEPRTGVFATHFDERSPHSDFDRMNAVARWNREQMPEYEVSEHEFQLVVPEDYDGSEPYGLMVFIHSSNDVTVRTSYGPRWLSDVETRNGGCLTCHEKDQQLLWMGSAHEQESMACDTCHDSHEKTDLALATDTAQDQCLSCHTQVRAQIHLPSRHPIVEGKTDCVDCHNPHGGLGDGALHQVSLNDNCYSCHQETRGPFLWEHPPVAEDCSLCHRPHGSVNERLLTARGPAMCQQCHAASFHPSVPYGSEGLPSGNSNRNLLGKNCMNCHSQVHGSNHPSGARLTR